MMRFLEDLAGRQRFGMKPGLDTITALCQDLGSPHRRIPAIHIAGTNGKGAVAAMLDECLRVLSLKVGRYTSPHLVSLNERFFLDGEPVDDHTLDVIAQEVSSATSYRSLQPTFFEALTAVAFKLYADAKTDYTIFETGLGGRLDATNICAPVLSIITKIGLDHCDWLGETIEAIAGEKAGIIKKGVPILLGRNEPAVRAIVEKRAKEVGAPFYFAPDLVSDGEIPEDLSLGGAFNRENALTAIAALKILKKIGSIDDTVAKIGLGHVTWPGRFQRVGSFLIDGAHNPPAARALAEALATTSRSRVNGEAQQWDMIFGACGDKDVAEVLAILKPYVKRGFAVRTTNPRSLKPDVLAEKMTAAGIPSVPCVSLAEALTRCAGETLISGSLFLVGEALVALNAYPWRMNRFDPSERLRA